LFSNRKQVQQTKSEAVKDGVTVPTTLKEYCISTKPPRPSETAVADLDFYDDDYIEDDEDNDDFVYDEGEDSGNSDS